LDAEIERSSPFAQSTSMYGRPAKTEATVENPQAIRTSEPQLVDSWKSPRRLTFAVVAMMSALMVVVSITISRRMREIRSNLNSKSPSVSTAPGLASERTITYWITVQKFRDGKAYQNPFDISGEINFEADYQIRLSVRSPQTGYLYVLNEGPAAAGSGPEYVVVFPSPTANGGSEFAPANQRIQIPDQTWLKFDKEQGIEKLWVVFSDQPVIELQGIRAFANPRTRGLITDPQQNRTVNRFLSSYAVDKVSHEKGETLTTLTSPQRVLVYPIRLEHH